MFTSHLAHVSDACMKNSYSDVYFNGANLCQKKCTFDIYHNILHTEQHSLLRFLALQKKHTLSSFCFDYRSHWAD